MKEQPVRGIGTAIKRGLRPVIRVIDGTLGTRLESCEGCRKRAESLDRLIPFKVKS